MKDGMGMHHFVVAEIRHDSALGQIGHADAHDQRGGKQTMHNALTELRLFRELLVQMQGLRIHR